MTTSALSSSQPTTTPATGPRHRAALPVMAVAAGLSVAGNYFAQPLLGVLHRELGLGTSTAGMLVAAAQLGYAAGLAVLVPLGDRFSRRGLAASLLVVTAVLLGAAGMAPNGPLLLVATALAAVSSVGAQVLVPFAAELGGDRGTGRAVAVVMSGVLLGGLVGRAASGALADLLGWRGVYWITAVLLVVMAAVVVTVLPASRPTAATLSLPRLLRSTAALLVELPALRRPIAIAALVMASYTVHLTVLTLLLSAQPYGWSSTAIGAFGFLGAVGALTMPLTGRIVDHGHSVAVLYSGIGLTVAAWLVMLPAASGGAVWLVAGVVLVNLGQQAVVNAAQTTAYALRPRARNRVNAVFMTLFFTAGALGSVLASAVWGGLGWTGACVLAALLAATSLPLVRRRS